MSNHIFYYISEVLLAYFKTASLQPGARFQIRYERQDQVDSQYGILQETAENIGVEVIPFTFNNYTSYTLKFGGYDLIIAASTGGIEVDFLTGLRNRTGDKKLPQFKNAAILFVHNTSLDSIIGGCKSLADAGMPLSSAYIKSNIESRINDDDSFNNSQKVLLNFRLAQVGSGNDDGYSLFDYSIYLEILGKKSLDPEDYRKFGLFSDKTLKDHDRNDMVKRLRQNDEWFESIHQAHQYGQPEKYLEKIFSPKGVEELSAEDWFGHDFTELEKFAADKDKIQNIVYDGIARLSEDLLIAWDREEGDSEAKRRIRHIILFNPDQRNATEITLNFKDRPKKDGVTGDRFNFRDEELNVTGKKIIWSISIEDPAKPQFKRFTYVHPGGSARHQFNLLVLPFKESLFEGFETSYKVRLKNKQWYIELEPQDKLIFNAGCDSKLEEVLKNDTYYNLSNDRTLTLLLKEVDPDSELEEISFLLVYEEEAELPFKLAVEIDKPTFISGKDIWHKKLHSTDNFKYVYRFDDKKNKPVVTLLHGTSRFYPGEESFRITLQQESEMIKSGHLAYYEDNDGNLIPNEDITYNETITKAYQHIVQYFRDKDLLPSLSVPDGDLRTRLVEFLDIFQAQLTNLAPGQALSRHDHDLFKVGTVEMRDNERLLKFTPLHPLIIAYQLHVRSSLAGGEIAPYLAERLRPVNLIPYFKGKRKLVGGHYYYQPIEQSHSAEWLHYFCDEVSSQQISKSFVPALVQEKLEQFLKHFEHLFLGARSCLRINLFNQGDGREILLGILQFYAKFFRREHYDAENSPSIQVRIYGSKNYITKFEELTLYDDIPTLERAFNFVLPAVDDQDELLELYSRKVTFFKIDDDNSAFEYAHLSFYQFAPSEVQKSFNDMSQVPTGVSLGGLLADVPSVYQQEAFRTGFGTSGTDMESNELLKLTGSLNALANVTHSDDQFNAINAIAFVINKNASNSIEKVYAQSQWVTFIEPKVDLSFFKSYRDVVIIHYSDQYNNASGYDAITITAKWDPYRVAIQEVFRDQAIELEDKPVISIIGMFNAINGGWLLAMNSLSPKGPFFRLEKLSILSAVKTSLAFLDHDDITWVPISMEEILRVSGAIGLRKGDGLFSVKNLGESGEHSDDVLMIGIEETDEGPIMHLYPIEVKIGQVEAGTIEKAKKQGNNTVTLLRKYLTATESLSASIYRNFFAKLMLIGAEKCILYDVWPEYNEKWERLKSLRPFLLQDKFRISNALDYYINTFGVIAFKHSAFYIARSISFEDNAALITLLKHDGLDYLYKDMNQLNTSFRDGDISPISGSQLLRQRYRQPEFAAETPAPAPVLAPEEEPEISLPEVATSAEEADTPTIAEPIKELLFNMLSRQNIEAAYQAVYEKLNSINVNIKQQLPTDIKFIEGPAFYRLQILPAPSTTIKKIRGVIDELNIALHLREGESVRVFSDLGNIWLEVPKAENQKVTVTTAHIWPLFEKNEDFRVPFGTDIEGKVQSINFSSSNSPHLLLAGTTGSGKSVVLETILSGAIHFYTPKELQLFLIDPKGNELIDFQRFTDYVPQPNGTSSDDAIALLNNGVEEMERRYKLFTELWKTSGKAAKDLNEYNETVAEAERLPRWLIVLDEYSDLLDEAPANKNVIETLVRRLSQKARAAGIHLIIATQKPLATILSSAIKSNLPGVIALRVRSGTDSHVILDDVGAETLAGKGDALFKNGSGTTVRVQCAIRKS